MTVSDKTSVTCGILQNIIKLHLYIRDPVDIVRCISVYQKFQTTGSENLELQQFVLWSAF